MYVVLASWHIHLHSLGIYIYSNGVDNIRKYYAACAPRLHIAIYEGILGAFRTRHPDNAMDVTYIEINRDNLRVGSAVAEKDA